MERPFESMTKAEAAIRFGAVCHWKGTGLTQSVYVLDCRDPHEALMKAHGYFIERRKNVICRHIDRIDVLPQDSGIYDGRPPVLTRNY